ncbi:MULTISPECIES: AraC family transcriptional regulator [unclassified Paenibacillus]|uniref:AraC family transcriptional regulator n=1 Tax=unclassified Paenibacillus TaxID=185978 RepID=UPI00083823F5|nr:MULTISPECIES: AraC family transcriptional regulator [unclassified Paenibacillus]NWL86631.1 AraC family transcriptional regulator [Paenibacillus sp. 79R4]
MIEFLNGAKETVSYREHFGIRIYLNQEAEDYPIHWHTAAEIIMPLENVYTAAINGTKYVLHPNDILVIPSGELHELFAPKSGKRIILQFDWSLLYNLAGFDSTFHLLRPCLIVTSSENEELHGVLRPLLEQLIDEYFSSSVLKEASAYSLLIQLFVVLGRNFMNQEHRLLNSSSQKQHKYIDKLLQVCNYMNEHCTEDIQVEDLSKLAGFSKFHFMRLFKQFIGMSYYDYLNQHRIMHAEKLLIDPNLSVMEIAMSSGFGSLPTFNRVFKKYKKCTPTEYKCLQGNHPPR